MIEQVNQHCEMAGHLHIFAGTGRHAGFRDLMTKVEETSKEAQRAMKNTRSTFGRTAAEPPAKTREAVSSVLVEMFTR
jgi:hypothetical protein